MNNLINFIKSKKIILITILSLSTTIFIAIKINNKNTKINVVPTPSSDNQIATYKNIAAGEIFNEDKINELLGYPVASTASGEFKVNNYRSSNEYRTNELTIKRGEVDFIREVVNPGDNKNADDLRNLYGAADIILYEKSSNSYFDLYIYQKKGIAYLGHKDGGILEIWYFKPMDIDSFIENYAPNYQKIPFTGQTGY